MYDALWPRYVEVCGVTQMVGRGDLEAAVLLDTLPPLSKGICRDDDYFAPATRVKKCGSAANAARSSSAGLNAISADVIHPEWDLTGPDAGVGLSTSLEFANVRWIATPGKKLFFHGLTGVKGAPFTRESFQREKDA